jgi:hypothetical protein
LRNWEELRKEFILGDYKNLREFADSMGIKYNSDLRKHASGWIADRKTAQRQTTDKIVSQAINKTAKRVSDQISLSKARQYQIATKLLEAAAKLLEDDDQFYKHLVKLRTGYGPGEFDEKIITEKAEAANTKAINNVAQAIKIAIEAQDSAMEYINAAVQEKLQIERERLALDRSKAEKEDGGNNETYSINDPFAEEGDNGQDRPE